MKVFVQGIHFPHQNIQMFSCYDKDLFYEECCRLRKSLNISSKDYSYADDRFDLVGDVENVMGQLSEFNDRLNRVGIFFQGSVLPVDDDFSIEEDDLPTLKTKATGFEIHEDVKGDASLIRSYKASDQSGVRAITPYQTLKSSNLEEAEIYQLFAKHRISSFKNYDRGAKTFSTLESLLYSTDLSKVHYDPVKDDFKGSGQWNGFYKNLNDPSEISRYVYGNVLIYSFIERLFSLSMNPFEEQRIVLSLKKTALACADNSSFLNPVTQILEDTSSFQRLRQYQSLGII